MIKVVMKNGFYYKGDVVSEDDKILKLFDIKGKTVSLAKSEISIREEDI